MKNRTKRAAWALSAVIAIGLVAAPFSVGASEEGRRNTAYALGAATLYFTLKKRPVEAIIAGGATAYAAKLLQDDINRRHRREKASAVNAARYNNSSNSYSYSYSSGVRTSGSSGGGARYASRPRLPQRRYVASVAQPGVQEGHGRGLSQGTRHGQIPNRSPDRQPFERRQRPLLPRPRSAQLVGRTPHPAFGHLLPQGGRDAHSAIGTW